MLLVSSVEEALKLIYAETMQYGLQVIGGIALLIAGWLFSGWAARTLRHLSSRVPNLDSTVASFLASLVRYGILALVGVAVLNQFGVQTASLIAVFGAAGLAIGLALQGTLSNLAAGVMLFKAANAEGIDSLCEAAVAAAVGTPGVLVAPPPEVAVTQIDPDGAVLELRAWCPAGQGVAAGPALKWAVARMLAERRKPAEK